VITVSVKGVLILAVEMKLYPRKKSAYFFLAMYGILAIMGFAYAGLAISEGSNPGNAVGFMLVFGTGMSIATLVKLRRPQIVAQGDYIEIRQSRALEYVRYRHIIGFSRPDRLRIVLRLMEDGAKREVAIWLKDFDERDTESLTTLIESKTAKAKG